MRVYRNGKIIWKRTVRGILILPAVIYKTQCSVKTDHNYKAYLAFGGVQWKALGRC